METQERLLHQLVSLQKETLRWTRFQSLPSLKETLGRTLDNEQKKQIYELTDGENTSRKIAALVKVNPSTVVSYWNAWVRLGIIEKEGLGRKGTTFQKIISLASIGIAVSLPVNVTVSESVEMPTENQATTGDTNGSNNGASGAQTN